MIITLHMINGEKITQDIDNLILFDIKTLEMNNPDVGEGQITINLNNVMYMHLANDEEKKHMEIHGW